MADLVTTTDITDRMGPLNTAQTARVAALIADASALARFEAKNPFESETDVAVVLRPAAGRLLLPGNPTSVTQVEAIGVPPTADLVLPVGTWAFDGINAVKLWPDTSWMLNLPEAVYDSDAYTGTYRVTYDRGWTTIPPEIVGVVCTMVIRSLTAPSLTEGLTGENIGQYGYQMNNGFGSSGAGIRATAADRAVLRDPRWRMGTARTIEVGA